MNDAICFRIDQLFQEKTSYSATQEHGIVSTVQGGLWNNFLLLRLVANGRKERLILLSVYKTKKGILLQDIKNVSIQEEKFKWQI